MHSPHAAKKSRGNSDLSGTIEAFLLRYELTNDGKTTETRIVDGIHSFTYNNLGL